MVSKVRSLCVALMLCCATITVYGSYVNSVDLIIFSYDRPLQLYALLESAEQYITGLNKTIVILRTSNEQYLKAYNQVKERFPATIFKYQHTPADFKTITIDALHDTSSKYIVFAVDDLVVKDHVNLALCAQSLEAMNAYGFYLRMGTNLSDCYSAPQPLPPLIVVNDDLYAWSFKDGVADWHYPNTVDMTLYRKKDILSCFEKLEYSSPNTLESCWAGEGNAVMTEFGLCFKESKVVNIPLNRVQYDYDVAHMNAYSVAELLELFNNNLKMAIAPLHKVRNSGAHWNYWPLFVAR